MQRISSIVEFLKRYGFKKATIEVNGHTLLDMYGNETGVHWPKTLEFEVSRTANCQHLAEIMESEIRRYGLHIGHMFEAPPIRLPLQG